MRQLAWLCGLVLLVSACTDAPKPPVGEGQALVGGAVVNVSPIAEPDSAGKWAVEVVECIGRGTVPTGVKWFVAALPKDVEPLAGLADINTNTIYLDIGLYFWSPVEYKRVVRHELAHLAVGWRAMHPAIPPTGRVDHTEPRSVFNSRCGTV